MFTGIITEIGTVIGLEKKDHSCIFEISANKTIQNKEIGQSIAVNGVCTTITRITENSFSFEAIKETLEVSNFKNLKENENVNLETSLTMEKGLDGHLVQGHVDTVGEVKELKIDDNKATLTIKFPKKIAKYLAFKGSITVNGVSLTIANLQDQEFSIELTQHTLENTNFKDLESGNLVNLETDLIARHLERLLEHKDNEAKYEFLKDRNLI